jgi:hypothetical protein
MNRVISYRWVAVVNNVEIKDLRAPKAPSISCNASDDIKIAMTGRFEYDEVFENLDTVIRCYQTVNGVTHPCYDFIIGKIVTPTENGQKYADVTCTDFCKLVKLSTCETRPFFKKSDLYTVAIEQALAAIGIIKIRTEHSDHAFSVDREDWERGTDCLTVINKLLSEIN